MTAAYRLKGLGWFVSVMIVAIGFYLISLQVAAERKKLADMNSAIATAKRDIRSLETEFSTRANLAQLEKWNGDVLAFTAPRADQFVADGAQLAAINLDAPDGAGGPGEPVRQAAYVVPTLHPLPGLDLAVEPSAGAVRAVVAPVVKDALAAPVVASAGSTAKQSAFSARSVVSRPAAQAVAAVAIPAVRLQPSAVRATSIALLDRKLLSDSTLSDLVSAARSEARSR